MVNSLLSSPDIASSIRIVIYTGDKEADGVIFDNVKNTFQIEFDESARSRVRFVRIKSRFLLEARNYPVLTMLGQALGSVYVGLESLFLHVPKVFIDTTGLAFALPIAKYCAGR